MHALLHRLGRRGLTLLLAGVAWGILGWALLTIPGERGPGILSYIPPNILGIAWIVSGAVGIAHCLARRPLTDALGFAVLGIVPAIWTVGSLWSWVGWLVWGPGHGESYGWANAVLFAWFTANLLITSGWAETPHLHTPENEQGDDE